MKKVLILAYDFPPNLSVGGQRPYSWCKYFSHFGLAATCVTRQWPDRLLAEADYVRPTGSGGNVIEEKDGYTVIRVPFRPNLRDRILLKWGNRRFGTLRKALTFLLSFIDHFTSVFDSKSNIYRAADELLSREKFDFIIATGEPFITFRYAYLLAAKYHIPWLADYRDGWTTNQGGYRNSLMHRMLNKFNQWVERKYTATAALLTTAAPAYKQKIEENVKGKRIEVVYNGYFEELVQNLPTETPMPAKFRIAYAGTIYPYQKLDTFMEGFKHFLQKVDKNEVELIFYGFVSPDALVKRKLELYAEELKGVIQFVGKMPLADVMRELHQSNLLLLLSTPGVDTLAVKLFDYIALRRPILLVENDLGIMERIMNETKAGVACGTSRQVDEELMAAYQLYKTQTYLPLTNSANYNIYSRRNQASVMAALIKEQVKQA